MKRATPDRTIIFPWLLVPVEILTKILGFLTPATLFLAQFVCHYFYKATLSIMPSNHHIIMSIDMIADIKQITRWILPQRIFKQSVRTSIRKKAYPLLDCAYHAIRYGNDILWIKIIEKAHRNLHQGDVDTEAWCTDYKYFLWQSFRAVVLYSSKIILDSFRGCFGRDEPDSIHKYMCAYDFSPYQLVMDTASPSSTPMLLEWLEVNNVGLHWSLSKLTKKAIISHNYDGFMWCLHLRVVKSHDYLYEFIKNRHLSSIVIQLIKYGNSSLINAFIPWYKNNTSACNAFENNQIDYFKRLLEEHGRKTDIVENFITQISEPIPLRENEIV